jgi:hypothetical protein
MSEEKCSLCSRPVQEGDRVLFDHGEVIHDVCVRRLISQDAIAESRKLIRRSRDLLDRPATDYWKPKNEFDGNGWPICPACTKPLRPAQGAKRSGPYMLHVSCPESSSE